MSAMCIGARWAVRYQHGEDWQVRILLCQCSESEFSEVMGEDPPEGSGAESRLWYCLTPDADAYPIALSPGFLDGACLYGPTGALLRDQKINRAPSVAAAIYGADWTPTLPEFAESLCFVSDVSYGDPVRLALPSAGPRPLPRMGQPALPAGTPADPLPIEWSVVKGALPASKGRSWRCLGRTESGPGVEAGVPELAIIANGVGLSWKGGQTCMVRSMTEEEMDEEVDARVLPLTTTDAGVRHLDFRGATRKLTETPWPN
jgi:hypothetical protein